MERRAALKGVAVAMGAMAGLPAWASGWSKGSIVEGKLLSVDQAGVLLAVVETIIPKTDTPGAGELGVDRFVQKMITDCHDKKTQEGLSSWISAVDEQSKKRFGKAYPAASSAEKLQLMQDLQNTSDGSLKATFGLVKNLTIQGYMYSEYVMTNITHYEMIPARYHGCVPIKG